MDTFLDIFFLVFHTAITVFNLFGWIWKPLRRLNLITLLLTGCSWFILGIFYGIGFCPLTEWHFQVLRRLGETNLPHSYIQYLFARIFSISVSPRLVETLTATGFFLALFCSVILNYCDYRRKKSPRVG